MLKLRWKLVASSWASHRQNSMLAKAEMCGLDGALVGDRELPDFQVFVQRDEVAGVRLDAAAAADPMMV